MTLSLSVVAQTSIVAKGNTREVQAGQHLSLGRGNSVRKEHLEEEGVKPVGFKKDQMAAEITRCSSEQRRMRQKSCLNGRDGFEAEEVLW